MENAGRNLAECAIEMLVNSPGPAVVLAGGGGNGGGGLCCARHLSNRGIEVDVILDRPTANMSGPAGRQLSILEAAGRRTHTVDSAKELISKSQLIIDALIGYSLRGSARSTVKELISIASGQWRPILSLDVPSGVDATSGAGLGVFVSPSRTMTLALPKSGLLLVEGDIELADIGIPHAVFSRIGKDVSGIFNTGSRIALNRSEDYRPNVQI